MKETPRWLDPEQKAAWDSFIRMQEKLIGRLSRRVQTDSKMSAADYIVLVKLTEAGGRLRFLELANLVEWEKSRMSHHLTRMEKRGLVRRESCDSRYPEVAITAEGRAAIEACAPEHAARIRKFFVDVFGPERLAALGEASDEVVETIRKHEASDCPPEVRGTC